MSMEDNRTRTINLKGHVVLKCEDVAEIVAVLKSVATHVDSLITEKTATPSGEEHLSNPYCKMCQSLKSYGHRPGCPWVPYMDSIARCLSLLEGEAGEGTHGK